MVSQRFRDAQEHRGNTVSSFITQKLGYQVGSGCRFDDPQMLFDVAERLAKRYREPADLFPDPGSTALSERQATVLAGLLAFTASEHTSLREMTLSQHGDFASATPALGDITLTAASAEADRIIGQVRAARSRPATPAGRANPARAAAPPPRPKSPPLQAADPMPPAPPVGEKTPPEPPAPRPAFPVDDKAAPPGRTGDTPPSAKPADENARPEPEARTAALPAASRRGAALLAHARAQDLTFGGLLQQMQRESGLSQTKYAQTIGLEKPQFARFAQDGHSKPPLELMNTLATTLGAQTPEEMAAWRRFMLKLPPEAGQERLNATFDEGSPHAADVESRGVGHIIALAKFFKLLAERHGLSERAQLARAIAQDQGLEGQATLVQRAIDNMSGAQENAERTVEEFSEAETRTALHRPRALREDYAAAVARFAYPGDETRQAACVDFLTSDRYKQTADEVTQSRSAAMTKLRAERGSNWGRRVRVSEQIEGAERK